MKNLKLYFALVFAAVVFNMNAQDWTTVKEVNYGYRADFPGKTQSQTNKVPTEKGEVTMYSHSFSGKESDKNLIYMSTFTEYPLSFFPNGLSSDKAQNTLLDGAVDGAVSNVGGSLISKESIVFNGYPGRYFKIQLERGATFIMTMRAVLVGYRFYMIQTIARKGDSDNNEKKRFFDSFELIKVKN